MIFHYLTCAISKQIVIQKYKFIVESSWSYVKISKYIISIHKLYIALWNLNKHEIVSLAHTDLGFGGAFPLCRKTQKEGEYFSNHSWNRVEIQITNDALAICQLFRYFAWN